METKVTKDGKKYVALSDEEIKQLPPETRLFIMDDKTKAIPPHDCKHSFLVDRGCPQNIKYCTKCIYWEFTMFEPPTEY